MEQYGSFSALVAILHRYFLRPCTRYPKYEIHCQSGSSAPSKKIICSVSCNHITCFVLRYTANSTKTPFAVLVCIHLCAIAVVECREGELDVRAKRNAPPTSLICISNFMQLLLLQLGPCRDFSLTPHFYGFSQRLGRITVVTI